MRNQYATSLDHNHDSNPCQHMVGGCKTHLAFFLFHLRESALTYGLHYMLVCLSPSPRRAKSHLIEVALL